MKKEAYGKEIKFGIVQNIMQMLVRYFVQKKMAAMQSHLQRECRK